MKLCLRLLLPAGALLLVLGTVSAACGGDDELTPLEEFFQQFQAIDDDFEERYERLEDEFPEDEGFLPEFKETLTELAVLRVAFVDELDTLIPPSEAADAFDEFLTAGRELVELQDEVLYPGDESSFQAVWEQYQDTCQSLQEIADANSIAADLECSEGL